MSQSPNATNSKKAESFWQTHAQLLKQAQQAIEERSYWSPYPEMPSGKIYGETAKEAGEKAFADRLGACFTLANHPSNGEMTSDEASPFGATLNLSYHTATETQLIAAAKQAQAQWQAASIETRTGICLEILHRINKQSFQIAHAVMHTTGQSFAMAFQAGGPHAQDRALEAVTYAYNEMTRTPANALWEKPMGKQPPAKLAKSYKIIPRGIALTIGCATFPTWNAYPGIFASLVTANAVIVKPHPTAILPLAISIAIARDVLAEAGFDPNILLMACDKKGAEITKTLVAMADINLIDYTGSNRFGQWVRENAKTPHIYTEEAGINPIVITGTDNFKGMCGNIAMSLSLYAGQMCTAPQNIFIPRDGIDTDEGHKSFTEIAESLKKAVDGLLGDTARATAILGAIINPDTLKRIADCANKGKVLRASKPVADIDNPQIVTPLMLLVEKSDDKIWMTEQFGPISFIIATDNAEQAIALAGASIREKGAITASIYANEEKWLTQAENTLAGAGALLSCNLAGPILVNQTAAFSDYHVSGANPAGNASLADTAFVANRFRIAAIRKPANP
ncbi:MAG: phenylacetic acid degradation protein PaaN [Alphaproteobacteria bacterium]|nr:phenylacetic acid degradation protein PaaN [Alphaproteobacteria bacterium]